MFDPERAHELCVEAGKDFPNGMIPIQTVYEMLLKMIGREDIIAAINADADRLMEAVSDDELVTPARVQIIKTDTVGHTVVLQNLTVTTGE